MNVDVFTLDIDLYFGVIVVDSIVISSVNNNAYNVSVVRVVDTVSGSKNSLICVSKLQFKKYHEYCQVSKMATQ